MNKCLFGRYHTFYGMFFSLLLLFSCKTMRKTGTEPPPDRSTKFLFEQLRGNELNYGWLNARLSASATIDKKDYNFNVNIRTRKDSIIWLSISSFLRIEVARLLISKDSVMFRGLDASHFSGTFDDLARLLNVDMELDFDFIQSILAGNYLQFYQDDKVFRSDVKDNTYILSTLNRRRMRKTFKDKKEDDTFSLVMQEVSLDPVTYKIVRYMMKDITNNRKVEAVYDDFRKTSSQLFPYHMQFELHAEKSANIELNYSRVMLDRPQKFPFKLPE